jgi:hypothetical protein
LLLQDNKRQLRVEYFHTDGDNEGDNAGSGEDGSEDTESDDAE